MRREVRSLIILISLAALLRHVTERDKLRHAEAFENALISRGN
jgi:hypothetical protein